MTNDDFRTARGFLDFMVDYYALTRRHMVETSEYKSSSHGFSLLYNLMNCRDTPVTMTKFAQTMGITKQQLTKLVNDLEQDGYVERLHNKDNRRQVYISITEAGIKHLETMTGDLTHVTLKALSGFTDEEKAEIYRCSLTLSKLFRKDAQNFSDSNSDESTSAENE